MVAVQVRDAALLTPPLPLLRRAGATYCLACTPALRPSKTSCPCCAALWPGPLVCPLEPAPAPRPPTATRRRASSTGLHADRRADTADAPAARQGGAGHGRGGPERLHPAPSATRAEGCAPLSVIALAEDRGAAFTRPARPDAAATAASGRKQLVDTRADVAVDRKATQFVTHHSGGSIASQAT